MRIAFPMFDVSRSGGNKVIVRLADASVVRGHEAVMLVPTPVCDTFSEALAPGTVVPTLKIPTIPYFAPTIAAWATIPYARALRDSDAIVANLAPTCLASKLAARKETRTYYLIQHDETMFFHRFTLEYWITRLSYTSFEEGRILVVSKWLQDLVRKRSGFKPVIVPPGIDHEIYYARSRGTHTGKRVLLLSRRQEWRGVSVFLEAMESVRKEVKDVRITAVGHSGRPLRTSCPVEYARPSDCELAELYASSDAFVLPSYLEGLPVPPLEAMACGGAVVLTDCLGTRDYAVDGRNCLMIPPRDSESMAEAILRVITDDALSERIRKNGPPTAAPWTYGRMGSIFINSIETT